MMGVYVLRHGQPCNGQPSYRKADCIRDLAPPAENVAKMGGCWGGPDHHVPWIMFSGSSEHGGARVGREHYGTIWGTLLGPALHHVTEQQMWRWPEFDDRRPGCMTSGQQWGISCFAMTEQEARQAVEGRERAILRWQYPPYCSLSWGRELFSCCLGEGQAQREAIANRFSRRQFPDHHPEPEPELAKPPPTITFNDEDRACAHNDLVEAKRKRSEGRARSALAERVYTASLRSRVDQSVTSRCPKLSLTKARPLFGAPSLLHECDGGRSTMMPRRRLCRCSGLCGACGSRRMVPSVPRRPSRS